MVLVLTGGFLGSGKTTAIVRAAQLLINAGRRVAVITNDQGEQQVDTAFVKSFGISTREVANGCFCCNYHQVDGHLQQLEDTEHPDFIFAESVGSCTDLIATIATPLHNFKPAVKTVISVFADADLLCSILDGHAFFQEESVRYIYKKQLEEADLLVLNKADRITNDQLKRVDEVVSSEYPGKIILHQNSLDEKDIRTWLDKINQFTALTDRNSLSVDYDVYGEGESKLAWLDKSITVFSDFGEAAFVTQQVIGAIVDQIQAQRISIGHLKFFIETENEKRKISFTTTSTSGDFRVNLKKTNRVQLLINARVETEPAMLEKIVDDVLLTSEGTYRCKIDRGKWSLFKPGFPRPTYRIVH